MENDDPEKGELEFFKQAIEKIKTFTYDHQPYYCQDLKVALKEN